MVSQLEPHSRKKNPKKVQFRKVALCIFPVFSPLYTNIKKNILTDPSGKGNSFPQRLKLEIKIHNFFFFIETIFFVLPILANSSNEIS